MNYFDLKYGFWENGAEFSLPSSHRGAYAIITTNHGVADIAGSAMVPEW